jgi:hypothetical protein
VLPEPPGEATPDISDSSLVIQGNHGRRIDHQPIWPLLRIDLVGIFPDAGACPECGGSLATPASDS